MKYSKKNLTESNLERPLLSDGEKFYEAKEFLKAKETFQILLKKHSDMPQSIEAKNFLANIDEEELWENASTSEKIKYTED